MPPVEVEAELKRRDDLDALVNWRLVNDADNPITGLSDPVIDQGARVALGQILAALGNQLTEGDEVTLTAATIAALQQVDVNNFPATQTDALTDVELRATPVPVNTGLTTQTDALTDAELRAAPVPVADDFPAGEILADQTGPGVLVFNFSAPVQTVWVYAIHTSDPASTAEVRVDPFGGTPTSSLGIPVGLGGGFPIPAITDEVAVLAPANIRVTVYGNRR